MLAFATGNFSVAPKPVGSASLLVVFGGDQPGQASSFGRRRYAGATDFHRLLEETPFDTLHLDKRPRGRGWTADLSPFRCVLNLVTDPDLNPRTLDLLRKLLRGFRGKVVNRPEAVLRSSREQVAACLAGSAALRVPKVVRLRGAKPELAAKAMERAALEFPVILRRAGTHTGDILGLIESRDALLSALAGPADHVATEFIDYRSADGLYRKYRVFFFGQRVIFRHMIVFDEWSVHGRSRMQFMVHRPDLLREEARLCAKPEGAFPSVWQRLFAEVRARMPLDFFGLDFGVDRDGEPVLFEANATMNFFPPVVDPRFDYLKLPLPAGRRAFQDLMRA